MYIYLFVLNLSSIFSKYYYLLKNLYICIDHSVNWEVFLNYSMMTNVILLTALILGLTR